MSTGISGDALIGRLRRRLFVGGVLAAACLAWTLPGRAAEPRDAIVRSDGSLPADTLVQEALTAEMEGRSRDRDRWTHEALKDSPDHPAAHWLDGQVRVGGRWIKLDDVPSLLTSDDNYQEYLRVRSSHADTAADQYRLGDWCRRRGLTEQARAHFTRVIQIDPNHARARDRLGYVRVGGVWRTSASLREASRQRYSDQDAMGAQGPKTLPSPVGVELEAAPEGPRGTAGNQRPGGGPHAGAAGHDGRRQGSPRHRGDRRHPRPGGPRSRWPGWSSAPIRPRSVSRPPSNSSRGRCWNSCPRCLN